MPWDCSGETEPEEKGMNVKIHSQFLFSVLELLATVCSFPSVLPFLSYPSIPPPRTSPYLRKEGLDRGWGPVINYIVTYCASKRQCIAKFLSPTSKCLEGPDQDGGGVGCGAHLLPTDTAKIHLHVERFSQDIYWTLAEDSRLPKGQENLHITG